MAGYYRRVSRGRKIFRIFLLFFHIFVISGISWAAYRYWVKRPEIPEFLKDPLLAELQQVVLPADTPADSNEHICLKEDIITENRYNTCNMDIRIDKVEKDSVVWFVADIRLADISYLKTAFAEDRFGRNIIEQVKDMALRHKAILAINGDFYGFRGTGIIIRNGILYRNNPKDEIAAIYKDGSMKTFYPGETDAAQLLKDGAVQTFEFGPLLIKDGELRPDFSDVPIHIRNPRTGFGMIEPNHYIMIVVDGRQKDYSIGMTLEDFARLFAAYGCTEAYNLDGGGSAAMFYNGKTINHSWIDDGRPVSEILYIADNRIPEQEGP